ncbi:MAG: MoaD family protein [Deltaproteobacteria bacterium]|nr:MoaD family protein [Deltaproteobacteria bacterium]
MASVRIPTPLRRLTNGQDEVAISGSTVGELLQNLEAQYPGIGERLCDESGKVRRFVNIYVNDEDIRFLNDLSTPIKDGDEVSIVPAIAGGAVEKKKIYLTYPVELIREPLIYQVGHRYRVVTNIRQASVSDQIGLVALELEGEPEEVEKAIAFFRDRGVKVEPVELNVIE